MTTQHARRSPLSSWALRLMVLAAASFTLHAASTADIRIDTTSLVFAPVATTPIYVELDWMEDGTHSHRPSQQVVDTIVATFAREGYSININVSNAIPHEAVLATNGSVSGSPAVQAIKASHFNNAGDSRYFYSIWAHNYSINGSFTTSSGLGDLPGSTHLVTLGSFSGQVGTFSNQVGTFVHEFGHNIGQLHGGVNSNNYKPNYISVMNYFYQLNGLGPSLLSLQFANTSSGFNNFGFSHGQLPSLNENSLNETLGIGLARARDWNCDGILSTSIARDIQASNPCNGAAGFSVLADYDNWSDIDDFVRTGAVPPLFTGASSEVCITAEEDRPIRTLVDGLRAQGLLPDERDLVAPPAGPDMLFATAQSFDVNNDGDTTLSVTGITLDSSAPWITFEPRSFDIAPGGAQRVYVYVNFGTMPAGSWTRRLLVSSNDPDENPYPGGVDVSVGGAPGEFGRSSPDNGAGGLPPSVTIVWTASNGADRYEYCFDTSNNDTCNATWISTSTNRSARLTGLAGNTTYYWHVRAIGPGGTTYAEGSPTAFWSFTTFGTPPPASPFGQVDTPAQNASGVQGAIGVTGWALDDYGVSTVQIYRNCLAFEPANCQPVLGNSVVYIGDAAFLSGARPDVAAAFPTYPNNTRAGWGYLMLTPLLPHVPNSQPFGGQGPLTLYVVATDVTGVKTLLGRTFVSGDPGFNTPTSFSMTNDTIAKPFGAIDTPGQGQTITGIFNNFGWAITPDINTVADGTDILVPTDGSTMTVFIDGQPMSLVAYNQCRGNVGNPPPGGVYCNDDVSNIFGNQVPQASLTTRTSNPTKFRNLDAARGAIGAYTFNTGTLTNGLHTIAWSVTDSAGRNEGIGSRFFNVYNGTPFAGMEGALRSAPSQVLGLSASLGHHALGTDGVWGRTGYDLATSWTKMHAGPAGTFAVRLPELGRLELWLGTPLEAGYLVAEGALHPLPVGSSLVGSQFAWMPPPGYTGEYTLAFIRSGERIIVTVTVAPRPQVVDGEAQVKMYLDVSQGARVLECSGALVRGCVRIAGQAFDPQAAIGSGIDAVHVWALSMHESRVQSPESRRLPSLLVQPPLAHQPTRRHSH